MLCPSAKKPAGSTDRPGRRLRIGILAWALAALPLALAAEPASLVRFDHLGVEDGISHTTVWDAKRDSRGFLWIGTETYLHRYDGYHFKAYLHDPQDLESLSANEVLHVFEDRQERLWLATRNRGLNRYVPETDRFIRYPVRYESLLHMREDLSGNLWLVIPGGLVRLDPETGRSEHITPGEGVDTYWIKDFLQDRAGRHWLATADGLAKLENDDIHLLGSGPENTYVLHEDPGGDLWVVSYEGDLYRYGPGHDRWSLRASLGMFPQPPVEDAFGQLWIGSYHAGLYRFDPASDRLDHWQHDPADPESLSATPVISTSMDRHGSLWVSTRSGVSRYSPRQSRIRVARHHPDTSIGLPGRNVMSFAEDPSRGVVWIGTQSSEVTAWNRSEDTFEPILRDGTTQLGLGSIRTLLVSRSGLWIGGDRGLGHLAEGQPFRELEKFHLDSIHNLLEDPDGSIWLGDWNNGLKRFDPRTGDLLHLPSDPTDPEGLPNSSIYALTKDREGMIWVGTLGGLARVDPDSLVISSWRPDPADPASLQFPHIVDVYEDASARLWLATYGGGLAYFDRQRGVFHHYRKKDGLANDQAVAILEDRSGNLWISTNQGISRFDPQTETFRNYDRSDGLASDVFLIGGRLRARDGELIFGGHGGLSAFYPQDLEDDPYPPTVVITDLLLDGEPVRPGEPGSPLERCITDSRSLTLTHRQRSFSLQFAALHFAAPAKNRYRHQLVRFDSGWIETDATHRRARYTNLNPGNYVFRVHAANKDGVWSKQGTSLRIRVLPAPWRTGWAYGLYALALGLGVFAYVRWNERRLLRERSINDRLREVDRLKNEFLANTSHELRTPLYGMTGLAESLLDSGLVADAARNSLQMIVASGRRLGSLVNDILDFSKLRHKTLQLDWRTVDLPCVVELATNLSQPLAADKGLRLETRLPADLPRVRADENRLQQILLNLIGNAVKFTESGSIEIIAEAQGEEVRISVVDTGIGIETEALERIFEPFEQGDASTERLYGGTGLGLAVTRQLVELHGGQLVARSIPGEGSTFTFSLAAATGQEDSGLGEAVLTLNEPVALVPPQTLVTPFPAPPANSGEGHPTVLIIDDEPVIRQVLASQLTQLGCRALQARGGEEALTLLEERPDLVLLDVMMPRMSGFEVCRAIREQHSLDELPVIYLTAKTQPEDLVTGFATGANDFLTKPVQKDELLARVRTHLDLVEMHRHLDQLLSDRTAQLETLSNLLPICSGCKKVRDDEGYWQELETYICEHAGTRLSHGLCIECAARLYPELDLRQKAR